MDKLIVLGRLFSRHLSVSSRSILQKSKKNPGVNQQQKILQESASELENIDMDDLESDFMNIHKSHKEHLAELEARREREKYLIVKQKYFKEKYPNFLTWHDKEQIRYLHNNDPDEWNIEKLAEGFPALPDIIEKIIQGNWTKANATKMSNHDRTVLKNWNDFKKGKLNNLPEELKQHLQKFTNRTLNFESFKKPDCKEIIISDGNERPRANGEFFEIISSYQRLKGANDAKGGINQEKIQYVSSNSNRDDSTFNGKKDNRLMTFSELQKSVKYKISEGRDISVQDKLLTEASLSKKDITPVELSQNDISNVMKLKHETNSDKVGFVRKTTRDVSHLIYPEKIVIPSEFYKKGNTYKLNDCYYDSDGYFLYRVPGMG